jgi:hypothetical protein
LTEKNTESKSDWPKFAGDVKKFRSWYLSIVAQVSLPPWNEFYDATMNNIVSTTSNVTLNGKLYSKLLLALESTALQNMVSRKHLRANGLALLRELVQTYKPPSIPEVIAAKTSEFWGQTKRLPHETVDQYFNRFHDLLDNLHEAEEPISTKSAICHFLFTLGSEFETIQNNYRIGNLPAAWKTQSWPSILALCRDYFNSVKPLGVYHRDSSQDTHLDMVAHKMKIREWFMNPTKYQKQIGAEQLKHVGKCLFHLTKSHPTCDCNVKKECDKFSVTKKSGGGTNPTSAVGQFRYITEEEYEDAVADDTLLVSSEDNDTNEESLMYFARLTNRYLHLVKTCNSRVSRHDIEQHQKFVINYLPYKLEDGTFTTKFELAHHQKPDLRVSFKPFALAAVRHEHIGDTSLNKFEAQSIPMIAIGHCPNSDGLQFFNPVNGTFVSSIDYTFQQNVTSGSKFGYSYQLAHSSTD